MQMGWGGILQFGWIQAAAQGVEELKKDLRHVVPVHAEETAGHPPLRVLQ